MLGDFSKNSGIVEPLTRDSTKLGRPVKNFTRFFLDVDLKLMIGRAICKRVSEGIRVVALLECHSVYS